jgi:hypothetical protein
VLLGKVYDLFASFDCARSIESVGNIGVAKVGLIPDIDCPASVDHVTLVTV